MKKNTFLENTFIIIWLFIIFSLFFGESFKYTFKLPYIIPNIISFIIVVIVFFAIIKIPKKNNKVSNKKFYILLTILSIISFIIQLVITINIYFKTGWDVQVIEELHKQFLQIGNINSEYLSLYPNNLLLILIYILIGKIPYIGTSYITYLVINNLIVNISSILTVLTIKRITDNNKLSLLSYFLIIPMIILNPWNTIIYTDTLGMIIPILVLFLYSKKQKKLVDWIIITLVSFIGLKLKPTVFLIYLAIISIEIVKFLKRILKKKKIKQIKYIVLSLLIIIPIHSIASNILESYLKYEPTKGIESVNFTHYMSMGQNDNTTGTYSKSDVVYTFENGNKDNFKRFLGRIISRSPVENIIFTIKKTMVNFNDGTFAWGREGNFFREVNTKNNNKISIFLKDIYYPIGEKFSVYIQVCQTIWIMIVTSTLFIVFNKKSKSNNSIILTLVFLVVFVTLFEARARYLICYIPIFIVTSIIGLNIVYKYFLKNSNEQLNLKKNNCILKSK